MNLAAFERAYLALFCFAEARDTGSLDCMKAISYVIRNRVKNGWGDGSWLSVIEGQELTAGSVRPKDPTPIASGDRLLQMLLRDIEDIYLGGAYDDTQAVVQHALYWQFVSREPKAWFMESILGRPNDHPRIGQVGPIMLFA